MAKFNIPTIFDEYIKGVTPIDVSCRSNSKTYYFNNGYYLKIDDIKELEKEFKMATIFHKLGIGSKPIKYISIDDKDYLLTEEVKGKDLTKYLDNPYHLCQVIAEALKKLHSIPTTGIPISDRYTRYMDSLSKGIESGYFDPSCTLKGYKLSKEEAWDIMNKNKDKLKCETFIHGDACLPNIIEENDKFKAFIDTGLSGIGDKHIDIYWALWSIEYNLNTSEYNNYFLELYGKDNYSWDILMTIMAFEVFG